METKLIISAALFWVTCGAVSQTADDVKLNMPIIQTKYTADPAPMVHDDMVFYILHMMKMMQRALR